MKPLHQLAARDFRLANSQIEGRNDNKKQHKYTSSGSSLLHGPIEEVTPQSVTSVK
jgi:hypothetical protein